MSKSINYTFPPLLYLYLIQCSQKVKVNIEYFNSIFFFILYLSISNAKINAKLIHIVFTETVYAFHSILHFILRFC